MSKVVKKLDPVGNKLGLYGGGGGGSKGPAGFKGKKRHQYVQQAKQQFGDAAVPGLGSGGSWDDYVKKVESGGFERPSPAPSFEVPSFEMPSFEMPDFTQRLPEGPKAQTLAEKLQEEAGQFAGVKAGERVFSAAQGVSTRLRAAVRQEEDDNKGGLGTLGESAGTILGRRGRGGATSRRRTRLSRY